MTRRESPPSQPEYPVTRGEFSWVDGEFPTACKLLVPREDPNDPTLARFASDRNPPNPETPSPG
jgi:hypothetical protein